MKAKKTGAVLLILLSVIYLLNPTAGLFEFLPDNIPFVGNIDDTLAVYVLFASIQYLRTGSFRLFQNILNRKHK